VGDDRADAADGRGCCAVALNDDSADPNGDDGGCGNVSLLPAPCFLLVARSALTALPIREIVVNGFCTASVQHP